MNEIDYTANLTGSLRLSASGEWFHNGVRFQNKKLAALFHRSIVWDPGENKYFVQIGRQRAAFDCDDTAYFVTGLDDSQFPCKVTLSDGTEENLDTASLVTVPEGQIYCTVKGDHRARMSRNVHQQLSQRMVGADEVELGGKRIKISSSSSSSSSSRK